LEPNWLSFLRAWKEAALCGVHSFPRFYGQRDHAGEPVGEVGYLCLGIEMYTEKAMARDYYPLIARR
jgi:hypothetical protein